MGFAHHELASTEAPHELRLLQTTGIENRNVLVPAASLAAVKAASVHCRIITAASRVVNPLYGSNLVHLIQSETDPRHERSQTCTVKSTKSVETFSLADCTGSPEQSFYFDRDWVGDVIKSGADSDGSHLVAKPEPH